ncbi:MAG: endolytic transglycosylase MltG [Bacteroidales bacterium]|nr:endolytic transglycosylase MltG [Bacteroidales bacterium]
MKTIAKLLAVLVGAVGLLLGYNWLRDNRMPNFYGNAELFVEKGDGPDEVIESLKTQLTILSERRLRKVFRAKEVATYIKPGHYLVNSSNSCVYVARMLNNGWQTPVRLTLAGSLRTREEIARKISGQLRLDSLSVIKAMDDEKLLAAYGATPENVFPAFFPATYELYWTAPFSEVLEKCKKASDAYWTEDRLAKAGAAGLSRKEAVILASIVKGESNYKPELPKIAGVYLNRLDRGMLLQADPTVAFCYDYGLKRILFRHLEFDSPYNTYKYPGLPPGPICVPDKDYLEAVLNADRGGGNLFFCASKNLDGTHVFAKTAEAHGRNAKAFQTALNNRG